MGFGRGDDDDDDGPLHFLDVHSISSISGFSSSALASAVEVGMGICRMHSGMGRLAFLSSICFS